MNLIEELLALVAALESARVPYALCGGLAVAVHGHPRFTKDIDLLVPSVGLERVQATARTCGFVLEGGTLVFGEGTPRERTIQRLSKTVRSEVLTLDLLVVGPALADVWNARLQSVWRGKTLWVVSRSGLLLMKRLSARPQDLADIDALSKTEPGQDDD